MNVITWHERKKFKFDFAQSARAVEYTDCFSAVGWDILPLNKCPGYDTKQFDAEVSGMRELEEYTERFSVEEWDPTNDYPGYDTK